MPSGGRFARASTPTSDNAALPGGDAVAAVTGALDLFASRPPSKIFRRRRPRTTESEPPQHGPPLLTGKKTRKFSDFSRFLRKSVPKTLGIQLFTNEFAG